MPALVSRYGRRGYAVARVDRLAQVDRFRGRIVVVGQMAGRRDDLHVVDAVVVQHAFGYVASGQAAGEHDFRVFLKNRLEFGLHDKADDADGDNQQKLRIHGSDHGFSMFLGKDETARRSVSFIQFFYKRCETVSYCFAATGLRQVR